MRNFLTKNHCFFIIHWFATMFSVCARMQAEYVARMCINFSTYHPLGRIHSFICCGGCSAMLWIISLAHHAYCSVDVAFITHWAWILNEFYLLLTSSAVVLLVVLVCSANVDAELKMNLHTYMQEYNMEMVYNNIGVWQFSSAWRWAAWCSPLSPPSLSSLPSLSLHQSNNFHMGIGPLVFAFTHASYAQCNENMNILQWSKFIVITFTNEWQRNRWAPRRTVL